eukprot:2126866-Pyramimonas_sp.AAC.1
MRPFRTALILQQQGSDLEKKQSSSKVRLRKASAFDKRPHPCRGAHDSSVDEVPKDLSTPPKGLSNPRKASALPEGSLLSPTGLSNAPKASALPEGPQQSSKGLNNPRKLILSSWPEAPG